MSPSKFAVRSMGGCEDAMNDRVTLPITHDADDLPRVGDVYEGREVVDRADSDDGRSVTLWIAEAP